MTDQVLERAKEHFARLIEDQLCRIDRMKREEDWVDYSRLHPVLIGVCGGDGIGPYITAQSQRVFEFLLRPESENVKVAFRTIEAQTIENRVAHGKPIPDDVLSEIRKCDLILKGPTTTPRAGDPWPNIESANVAMRRELDLFANVRPVRVPSERI